MSDNIEILQELNKEFLKYREWGYNRFESAEQAIDNVFKGQAVKPHIYKDQYEDASHIFYKNSVLFFGDEIYTSIKTK